MKVNLMKNKLWMGLSLILGSIILISAISNRNLDPKKGVANGLSPYLGEMIIFAGSEAPSGWEFCNGQILSIANNNALYSIIGNMYGGDGRTTFALPDLRGRVAIHHNKNYLGYRSGQELVNEISKYVNPKTGSSSVQVPSGKSPVDNHQPFLGLNHLICVGPGARYPSRRNDPPQE